MKGKGQREHKFLGHAAGKINDLVMPEVTVKTPIGRTVRIAVLQGQDYRDLGQSSVEKRGVHGRLLLDVVVGIVVVSVIQFQTAQSDLDIFE